MLDIVSAIKKNTKQTSSEQKKKKKIKQNNDCNHCTPTVQS